MRTSLYSILCIVIRLGAVLLAVNAIADAASLYTGADLEAFGAAWVVGSLAAVLLVAAALWIWPGILARLAAGRGSAEVFESPLSAQQLQWIALSVLGAYFVVDGVGGLVFFVFQQGLAEAVVSREQQMSDWIVDGGYWAIRIGCGITLVFGARGLVGMLRGLREHGLPPARRDGRTGRNGEA